MIPIAFNASSICPVLSAGQIFSIHCSAIGLQFVVKIVEFDAHADLKSVTLTALSAGDNVLYTCPANRTAIVFDALPSVQSAAGQIGYTNQSGGARTVLGKIGSTQFGPSVAPATATATTITCPSALAAGEILKVNVDANTATQLFWVTVTEVDVANNG